MQNRQNALEAWLKQTLAPTPYRLTPLAGDASFRRYFRLHQENTTRVIMDAPPEKETVGPFIAIGNLLSNSGVRTPRIHALDEKQGFIVLDDLGDELLLNQLNPKTANTLYTTAINTLIKMQNCPAEDAAKLPSFDKSFMLQELGIFIEWFLQAYLEIELSNQENVLLETSFNWLTNELLQQPQFFIHRDYHSRNLMILNDEKDLELAVIDFQDAMQGPFTYDLVSLLKDCYIQWPREQVTTWLTLFYKQSPLAQKWSLTSFTRGFDLCGLQRHLKVLGVFSRLHLRDNKSDYLADLPLTLNYVMACLENYAELKDFYQFMQARVQLP